MKLTVAAQEQVKFLCEKNIGCIGMFFGVFGGGCRGFSIKILLVHKIESRFKEVSKIGEFAIFSDEKSLEILKDTTVDFEKSFQKTGFLFLNTFKKCGCGNSFDGG